MLIRGPHLFVQRKELDFGPIQLVGFTVENPKDAMEFLFDSFNFAFYDTIAGLVEFILVYMVPSVIFSCLLKDIRHEMSKEAHLSIFLFLKYS